MRAAARLEIFTATTALQPVQQTLDALGAPGYSVISGVTGRGRHGRREDDLIEASACVYIICICEPAEAERLGRAIAPVLDRYGGICTIAACQAPA